tara:strand:- start:2791 stop:2934 length:144 start_codon:yes stop_codon:yes gene_type:complete
METTNTLKGNPWQGSSMDNDRRMNNVSYKKKKKKKKMKTMEQITKNA